MKNVTTILLLRMKKILLLGLWSIVPMFLNAGITTYTFTSKSWASKIDATVCDGVSDGWICDKEAYDYSSGRQDAEGRLYSQGVSVKTSTSGAGATSVQSFENVRRITVNFCQNASKGKGVIYFQVGENTPDSIVVRKPAESGKGVYNRDSIVTISTPKSGKIKFWITCTENAININQITIRSSSGALPIFSMDSYQLVTDVTQLQDSDQVIFGVAKAGCNYIMGYFDEWVSVNNIHAIAGHYSADRMTVEPDDRAIYTLWITELDGKKAYVFQDELRYEEAYLVASGGKTKNRLALWNNVVDEKTYGNYGFWDIQIENGGEAVITNMGNSVAKIIQYNAMNTPTIFACYADKSQTPVCLYRRVEAIGDVEAIVAPMVNFGTTIEQSGSRTIQVNANKLTEDISVSLVGGEVFSLSATSIDRDGDDLTISYSASAAGHYTDTLVLRSGNVETRVAILLNRIAEMAIKEAVHQPDYTMVYLNDVVVTKKYDTYIYIRDETGSMLIFDRGNGDTGKRYGADLKTGDQLSGVTGRMQNYYGVPELSPDAPWTVGTNIAVLPEPVGERIDSSDVCRYLVMDSVVIEGTQLTYKGNQYAIANKFNLPDFIEQIPIRVTCIVSYDWDVVTLYIVSQEIYPTEGIEQTPSASSSRVILHEGIMYVETEKGLYTLQGEKVL